MKKFLSLIVPAVLSAAALFAAPPKDLNFPPLKFQPAQAERRLLSCGATVFLLPDPELPLINITAYVRTGAMYESPDKVGVASLCGTLLRAGGTKTRRPDDIDDALEYLSASVETGMDTELGSASLSVLSKDLKEGLAIFADVLMNPAFDKGKLELEKAKLIEGIRRRNDEPFAIARRELRKLIYGKRHPLARVPEIPVVKKISQKDLMEFYRTFYHPNNMMLAVSGDFETDAMVQKLESLFKNWQPVPVVFPPVETVQRKETSYKVRQVVLASKDLNQASVLMGHLGLKRHNPDRFPLEVLNEILGGSSFTSRLYKEVRSREGLAYWVGSSFSEPWDYGTVAAGCQTKTKTMGQAVNLILKEMETMRREEVTNEELKLAKDSIINSFVFRYASAHAIVSQKMALEYYGFAPDYLDTYTDKISKVTARDVLNAAQRYLNTEDFKFAVVGNDKYFDVPVTEFGVTQPADLSIEE